MYLRDSDDCCYHDNAPEGRLLRTKEYNNYSNTDGLCQPVAQAGRYIFAGKGYRTQCWKGNTPLSSAYKADESLCAYSYASNTSVTYDIVGSYIGCYTDRLANRALRALQILCLVRASFTVLQLKLALPLAQVSGISVL